MKLPFYVEKYLNKFSSDKWNLETSNTNTYNTIVVIPALEEYEGIRILIESLTKNDSAYLKKTLLIFVINNLASLSTEVKENNASSIEYLKNIMNRNHPIPGIKRICESGINLGIVDASSPGNELPEKEGGVGLARKTGMDLALRRFNYENGKKNLLVCLDGDCTVASNYLDTLFNINQEVKSGYVQYRHVLPENEEQKLAIICYEIFLRYYVLGLSVAESPYAFHTIGSTLFCDAESYVKIQGMNKRKAAEDFYFIEKLSKINKIFEIKDTAVFPSSRPSWRVPFGTGQRVNRYLSKEQDEYSLYSFKSFLVLKEWLKIFLNENNDPDYLLTQAKRINNSLHQFLIEQKFSESWDKILKNNPDTKQLLRQKKYWFDGFKTLKLIHYLRDKEFPNEFMFDVLNEAFEYLSIDHISRTHKDEIPSVDIQKTYLELLRLNY